MRKPGVAVGIDSSTGAGSTPKPRQMAEASPRAKVVSSNSSSWSFSSARSFANGTFMALATSSALTPALSRIWRNMAPAI
jgi:hypothetical protein